MSRTMAHEKNVSKKLDNFEYGNTALTEKFIIVKNQPNRFANHAFSRKDDSFGRGYWWMMTDQGERKFCGWSGRTLSDDDDDNFVDSTSESLTTSRRNVKK